MNARALGLATLLLSAAAGCTVGPRYEKPKVAVPPAWSEGPTGDAGTAAPLERWWTAFRDPVLDNLVARAVAGNLDLEIAAARVLEARAARGIATAAALPRADAGADATRLGRSDAVFPFKSAPEGPSPFGPRTQNLFEAGFDASWEIDVFGGVRRDVEAARADVQASEEARRDVLVTLLADVARSYVELRGAQRRLEVLDRTLASQRETLDLARSRFEAGLGTGLDIARAEALVAATAGRRPPLEQAAKVSIFRLGVLLGKDPEALLDVLSAPRGIPPPPPDVPRTLPSELLDRRPDLRRAERELAAATARVGVATANLFPRFSILGGLGRRSAESGDLASGGSAFWSLGSHVSWPVFSGGRILADVRVKDARREQAAKRFEKAILTALEEVESALSAHAEERSRQESLRASVDASRRSLDLATRRYVGGLENFLSVLDARRELYASEDLLIASERDVATALIAVYKSLGGGWSLPEGGGR